MKVAEVVYDADKGKYTTCAKVSLPSVGWSYTDATPDANGTEVVFNISAAAVPRLWTELTLRNHVFLDADTSDKIRLLKFDVILRGYQWKCDDAQLQIQYKLLGGPDDQTNTDNATEATFGATYFSVNPTAAAGNGNIGVHLSDNSTDGNSPWFYVTYDHFDSDLYHDPELGYVKASPPPPDNNVITWVVVACCLGAATLVVVGVICYVVYRKTHSKDKFTILN
eukprot:TRINITY_DN262_c0_g2_i1.p1 TRINITY_DN262_c0_g2~~TRINITY_DN262_c0_g2_i1.p1  ORF type:complete len:224 (+),score=74.38 TRINITY_DN262_c0_g2_i1:81-752(+)